MTTTALQTTTGANPDEPTYQSPSYRAMLRDWTLCQDMKAGTDAIRDKAATYLPRFSNEEPDDWKARVAMTFPNHHYESALEDLVGLAAAEPWALTEQVPEGLKQMLEDADGRGAKWDIFGQTVLDAAIDDGFAAILTEYPAVPDPSRTSLADVQRQRLRPYWCLVRGTAILSFRTAWVGGVEVLTQVVIAESRTVSSGRFGTVDEPQWRVYRQAVTESVDGQASLGAVTWELWRKRETSEKTAEYYIAEAGAIVGPKRIPLRIVYGGPKQGTLHATPFLLPLAHKQLEETQVASDYAAVMHRCNVPTPWFTGLLGPDGKPIVSDLSMGNGIALPLNAEAGMLEPAGAAIGATRQRLLDILTAIQRFAGAVQVKDQTMTALEAAIAANQRNARLARAVQSLEDAMAGALEDMGAFAGVAVGQAGTVTIPKQFGATVDPAFLNACILLWKEGGLELEDVLHVLQTGKLPDEFDAAASAKRLLIEAKAREDAALQQDGLANGDAGSGDSGDAGDGTEDPQRGGASAGSGAQRRRATAGV